jgi:hypothetical protein
MSLQVLMGTSLAEDDLPAVVLTDFENDRHRQEHDVEEVIRIAYRLAEVGAGYEAARVLAAIALWEQDRDSRNEATHLLNEWGLTINTIRQGNVKDIIAKVESAMRYRRGSNTKLRHVRNLIALGLYVDAAHLLHQGMMQTSESMIERAWGEFHHHATIQPTNGIDEEIPPKPARSCSRSFASYLGVIDVQHQHKVPAQ